MVSSFQNYPKDIYTLILGLSPEILVLRAWVSPRTYSFTRWPSYTTRIGSYLNTTERCKLKWNKRTILKSSTSPSLVLKYLPLTPNSWMTGNLLTHDVFYLVLKKINEIWNWECSRNHLHESKTLEISILVTVAWICRAVKIHCKLNNKWAFF